MASVHQGNTVGCVCVYVNGIDIGGVHCDKGHCKERSAIRGEKRFMKNWLLFGQAGHKQTR